MTDHHHPDPPRPEPPSRKQLRYLRELASRTGRTFVPPKTKREASKAIAELQETPRAARRRHHLDRPTTWATGDHTPDAAPFWA